MATLKKDYDEAVLELKSSFRAVAGFSVLASICVLAMPAFMFQVYDRVLISRSSETLIAMLIIALIVMAAYGVFDAARQALLIRAGTKFEGRIIGLVLGAELARQSDANTQSVKDIASLRSVIGSPVFGALFDLPMMPIFTLIIFLIHPVLGFVLLAGGSVLVGIAMYGERVSSPRLRKMMEGTIKAHKALEGVNTQQEMVRAQGMYREATNLWGRENADQLAAYSDAMTMTTSFSAATKAMRQILQILMIATGGALVLGDMATPGVIFAGSIIGSRALAPIEQLVGGWRNLKQAIEARKRLEERLEDLTLPTDRTPIPRPKGQIMMDGIAYVPRPGGPMLIKGLKAGFAAGDSTAIIGASGSGKTTLARMLVGYLEPTAGRLLLDGQDLRAWDPVARGLHIGYLPQSVSFFEGTIRENIARMRVDDAPEYAIEAAQKAGIHDIIMTFPEGYDTLISKGGFWPSGGQAQLIALARAFYGNPAVLVLDEPNASLDNAGEQILHKSLAAAKNSDITVIVVTQRPSILQFVDKVMLLEGGNIKDYGPKDKVLAGNNVRAIPAKGKAPAGGKAAPAAQTAQAAPAGQTAAAGSAVKGQAEVADAPKKDVAKDAS